MVIIKKCPKCQGTPTMCEPVHIGDSVWSTQIWCNDCDWVAYGDGRSAKASEYNAKYNWNNDNGMHMNDWLAQTESK